jgi:hypothetical protein
MFGWRTEVNDGRLIAAFLPLLPYFSVRPPDKGMKPVDCLSYYLENIGTGVKAGDMASEPIFRPHQQKKGKKTKKRQKKQKKGKKTAKFPIISLTEIWLIWYK